MKVSDVKGLANRNDPESCGGARKGDGEALTGESAGWVLSRENPIRDGDPVETPGMHGTNLRENREILRPTKPARLGRIEKSKDVRR